PGGATNSPLFNEISSLVHSNTMGIQLSNYIVGLGGRDVNPEDFHGILDDMSSPAAKGSSEQEKNYRVIGVRG
ncbi:MAG: hypothetical protein PHU49_17150, partial [Syntrophorhabdaceae bacterium]|nr:hypothetical protein [Syntrophorhabdaceae bacterium]